MTAKVITDFIARRRAEIADQPTSERAKWEAWEAERELKHKLALVYYEHEAQLAQARLRREKYDAAMAAKRAEAMR
jgi:hypothetical protein